MALFRAAETVDRQGLDDLALQHDGDAGAHVGDDGEVVADVDRRRAADEGEPVVDDDGQVLTDSDEVGRTIAARR